MDGTIVYVGTPILISNRYYIPIQSSVEYVVRF